METTCRGAFSREFRAQRQTARSALLIGDFRVSNQDMNITTFSSEPERLAVNDAEVAKLLHISRRHVAKLDASGRLPRPLRFGRSKRWDLHDLRLWSAAGAPPREKWEAMKGVSR